MRKLTLVLMTTALLAGYAPEASAAMDAKTMIKCMRGELKGPACGKTHGPSGHGATAPAKAAPRAAAAPHHQGKLIEISISQQTLRAWDGNHLVLSTPVSTGAPGHETPRGRFKILSKERNHWSNQYKVWMPYAMRVVGGVFIHELPITTSGKRIGLRALGGPASHGCIRVGIGPAASLFNWSQVGTPVLIH